MKWKGVCISIERDLNQALEMQPLLVKCEMEDSLDKSKSASVKELSSMQCKDETMLGWDAQYN